VNADRIVFDYDKRNISMVIYETEIFLMPPTVTIAVGKLFK